MHFQSIETLAKVVKLVDKKRLGRKKLKTTISKETWETLYHGFK